MRRGSVSKPLLLILLFALSVPAAGTISAERLFFLQASRRIKGEIITRFKEKNLKVNVVSDYEMMSRLVAERLTGRMQEIIQDKGRVVVCFASGGTMERLYEILRTRYKDALDWSKVVSFNLDEYVGLAATDANSYRYYMDNNLFNHVAIKKENINFLDGLAPDLDKESGDYEQKIKASGGIDIMLLGIGRNGHIAFNMPHSDFYSRTRLVELDEITRRDNARFFGGDISRVPTQALSVGIATINESGQIILLASGTAKRDIITKTIFGPVIREIPATILQWHPNTFFIIDRDAYDENGRKTLRSDYP